MTNKGAVMAQGKAPWCGLASWLGVLAGWGAGWLAALAFGGSAPSAGLGVAVLASVLAGGGLAVGARVRGERYPWLGIGGAVVSALPLVLFLLRMLLKL